MPAPRIGLVVGSIALAGGLLVAAQPPTNTSGNEPPARPSAPSGNQTPSQPAPGGATAVGAGARFTLGEGNVVRVPATTTTLSAAGVAGADKLSGADLAKLAATLVLKDMGLARGPAVEAAVSFSTVEFIGRTSQSGLTWRVGLAATAPLGTSHARLAQVTLGTPAETHALEYTVSAKPAAAAQWTVRGAADVWTISWTDPLALRVFAVTIENQDERLTNVRVAQSTLKDASGHAIGVDRLQLVEAPSGLPVSGLDVAPNNTRTAFLRLQSPEDDERFGTFDGVVRFTADGSSATKDVSLKLQASSRGRKIGGAFLTLAGLLLAMFVSARLRPELARLQAQRAAAAVRQALADFQRELGGVYPKDLPPSAMAEVAGTLAESISDRRLDRDSLLPPRFTVLPGGEPPADRAAELKTRLEAVSARLEGLLVLLRTGVVPALRQIETEPDTARALIIAIDEQASSVSGAQDARTKLDAARAKVLRRELAPTPPGGLSLRDIDFQIQSLSVAAWSIWAMVALIIGAVWIAADIDYGTPLDLVGSFLWGFGMTAFGAGIQNLTPSSVATQLNVKVPR